MKKNNEHLNNKSLVGIVANPASGKDIRRLVAQGAVFDNNQKTNILERILLAMDAMGVEAQKEKVYTDEDMWKNF